MKTLYIDCSMGAAGDMLTAALTELLPDRDAFLAELNDLGIPGVKTVCNTMSKCGINGTHVTVTVNGEGEGYGAHIHGQEHKHGHEHEHEHEHEHVHSGMHDIEHIVEGLKLSPKVKADILDVYKLIAEAESHVHGVPVTEIHFHEVGAMDAVADIAAVSLLMEKLSPQQVIVSPVHVGSGQVRCRHGVLPVPAPATAYILREVPIYGGKIRGELCTPTGAALLKHFADSFGAMPVMRTTAIGYGMGSKDFDAANCVRVLLGETGESGGRIYELNCNVDDMTAEELAFAMEKLFEKGALDVFTVPIGMKKSRPGILLRVLCNENKRDEMVKTIFRHTSTIGVRETECSRYVLDRKVKEVETPLGKIHRKDSFGYGVERSKYEYEDLVRIAREKDVSIAEVLKMLENR